MSREDEHSFYGIGNSSVGGSGRGAKCNFVARLVEGALRHFDGVRYVLIAWCIMPNHVHTFIRTRNGWPVGHVVQSWKRHTLREANRLLGGDGAFWALDYYDRFIRDEAHDWRALDYIHHNPVKAGLCASVLDWEWSSAWEWNAKLHFASADGAAAGEQAG